MIDPFVNYVRSRTRRSPVNLAVARILLCAYLIWKVISEQWAVVVAWPEPIFEPYSYAVIPHASTIIPIEQWVVVGLLCAVAVGYRLGLTGFLSAFLLTHLGLVRFTLSTGGETDTYFFAAFILLFFAIYRQSTTLTIDRFRQMGSESLSEINEQVQSAENTVRYDTTILALSLLLIASVYFGSAFDKAISGPLLQWTSADSMTRWVQIAQLNYDVAEWTGVRGEIARWLASLVYRYPPLAALSAWGTVFLESGLLIAALAGITITPFVLGLLGMHVAIALLLSPFFFDNILLLIILFAAWDQLHEQLTADTPVDLVYDEHCHFCARVLYLLDTLDTTGAVRCYTQYDAPDRYRDRDGVGFSDAMYVFADGDVFEGYEAFRRVFRQYGLLYPLVGFMGIPPVVWVGKRIYNHIAANRSRYFVCSAGSDDTEA